MKNIRTILGETHAIQETSDNPDVKAIASVVADLAVRLMDTEAELAAATMNSTSVMPSVKLASQTVEA